MEVLPRRSRAPVNMYTASVLLPASVDWDGIVCRYRERGWGRLFRGSSIYDQDEVRGEAAGAVRTAVYFVSEPNHLSLLSLMELLNSKATNTFGTDGCLKVELLLDTFELMG